jgi:hypothetical protein
MEYEQTTTQNKQQAIFIEFGTLELVTLGPS